MNFVSDCLDEIALEGLDGITLSALWVRLDNRKPSLSLSLDSATKEYLWLCVRENVSLEFYELPTPRPPLVLCNRFEFSDPETGVIMQQNENPEDIYPVSVVKDPGGRIMGSCKHFYDRRNITDSVRIDKMDLNSIIQRWGEKFVIVASQKLRSQALFGYQKIDPDIEAVVVDIKYAVLERIGRSRCHGELTQSQDGLRVFELSPKALFYIRKILRSVGAVSFQYICVRTLSGASISGRLIHLTRFFVEFRPMYVTWLEELTTRLAAKPQQMELFAKIRSEMGLKEKTFKKLCVLGKTNIKSEVMKFRDLYPEADESEYLTKSKSCERVARIIRLIKPFKASHDDDDENDEKFRQGKDDDNELMDELDVTVTGNKITLNKDSAIGLSCERPMLHQALKCIEILGSKGQSQIELANKLGITRLDSRTISRSLIRKGFALKIMKDEGRNRVSRAVAKQPTSASTNTTLIVQSVEPDVDSLLNISEIRKVDDSVVCENSVNQSMGGDNTVDVETTTAMDEAQEKEMLLKNLKVFPDDSTIRTLRRANSILTAVRTAKVVIDSVLIQKKIRSEEAELSCVMDRKSFLRLVEKLCETKMIKQIAFTVQLPSGHSKEISFLCDVSVSEDDQLVKSACDAAKQKLLSSKSETCINLIKNERFEQKSVKEEKIDDLVYDLRASKRYGSLSRMARLKTLHQLLWCLTYKETLSEPVDFEAESASFDPTKLLLSEDIDITPELLRKSCDASHISMLFWHKMLPSLPRHAGYGEGWGYVSDILQVIPLFIICQTINIPYKINGLEEFLDDHAKRFTPFQLLPVEWQKIMSYKRRYVTSLHRGCKSLAELGLLTFGKKDFKQKEQCYIYVHKFAKLVDTTVAATPRSEFPVRLFKFDNFKDVEDYWLSMQSISFNTPRENIHIVSQLKNPNFDGRFDECLAEKEVDQISDLGTQPGDGMGAAGIDSTFFVHLRRNWSRNADVDVKMESLIDDSKYQANDSTASSASTENSKRKQRVTIKESSPPASPVKCKKTDLPEKDPNIKYTKVSAAGLVLKKGGKGIKRKHSGIAEGLLKKSRLKRFQDRRSMFDSGKMSAAEKRKRRPKHDSKDVDAMRLLKRLRVTWTPPEDSLLLLCQLTNQFLTGNNKLCLVSNAVIRDIMHENLAVARDKTRLACARRIKYMMKNNVTVQNVQMYLGEALQDRELVSEFKEGKKYVATNVTENVPVFRRCLAKMRAKFRYENESVIDIPDTLAEFHNRFSIINSLNSRKTVHRDVTSASGVSGIFFSVLHNLIHAAIVLTDKIGRSHELFQLFRMYPEPVLDSVFTSMKNDKILTKIKKGLVSKNRLGGIPVATIGTYQISQRYMFFWLSAYSRSLIEASGRTVRQLPPDPDNPTFGSDYLLMRNLASDCVATVSLMSLQLITFSTTIPEQIVVIDKMPADKDLRPQKKRPRYDDNDSDLEEEDLIEEAERLREQDASSSNSDEKFNRPQDVADVTPSVVVYDNSTSSRTSNILSCRRCQYVHSQTVRLISANDNLFVNACEVRIRLKPCELRDADVCRGAEESAWTSDFEAHKKITKWNKTHVMLHPKTCRVILKTIRTTFPDRMKTAVAFNNCCQRLNSNDHSFLTRVLETLSLHEYLGMTVYELKAAFSDVGGSNRLMDLLAIMVECRLVVRVGVTVFRYVCFEFASSWLIRIDKNLKGRGHYQPDEDECTSVPPDETRSDSNGGILCSSSTQAVENCQPASNKSGIIWSEVTSLLQFQNPSADKAERSESINSVPLTSGKRRIDEEEVEGHEEADGGAVARPSKCPKLGDEVELEPMDSIEPDSNHSDAIRVDERVDERAVNSEVGDEISAEQNRSERAPETGFVCPPLTFSDSSRNGATVDERIDLGIDHSDLLCSSNNIAASQPMNDALNCASVDCSIDVPETTDNNLSVASNDVVSTCEIYNDRPAPNLSPCLDLSSFSVNESTGCIDETPNNIVDSGNVNLENSSSDGVKPEEMPSVPLAKPESIPEPIIDGMEVDANILKEERLSQGCLDSNDCKLVSSCNPGVSKVSDANCTKNIEPSDNCCSSEVNSVPKILRRPRDFLKSEISSAKRARSKVPFDPASYRMPTWLIEKKSSGSDGTQEEPLDSTEVPPGFASSEVTASVQTPSKVNNLKLSKTSVGYCNDSKAENDSNLNSRAGASSENEQTVTAISSKEQPGCVNASSFGAKPMSSIVRLGSSGTCTTITVLSPETKPFHRSPEDSKRSPAKLESASKLISCATNGSALNKSSVSNNHSARGSTQPSLPRHHFEDTSAGSVPESTPVRHKPVPIVNQFIPQCTPRFSGLPQSQGISAGSPSSPQSIRIRVHASSLNSASALGDLTKQIEALLMRQGTLAPGQQVRVRLPPGLTVGDVEKADNSDRTSEPRTDSEDAANSFSATDRLPQLDGATDDLIESPVDDTPVQVASTENDIVELAADVNSQVDCCVTENMTESVTNDATKNDLSEGRNLETGLVNQLYVAPLRSGTYKKVRLVPRPWRTPEGTINRPTLQTMLESLLLFITENPATTRNDIIKKYNPVLQPVAIFELLEILEEIGCLNRMFLKRTGRSSLFSARSHYSPVSEDTGLETEVFLPTGGCILKLGQFVVELNSGLQSTV